MFFKKKTQSSVLAEMGLDFTFEQKCAIIGSLMVLSQVDGDIDKSELQVIESTSRFLDLKLDSTVTSKLQALKNGGMKRMFAILDSLPNSEKTWYIITVHLLLSADGVIADEELACLGDILKAINVSFEDYGEIVEKARHIID